MLPTADVLDHVERIPQPRHSSPGSRVRRYFTSTRGKQLIAWALAAAVWPVNPFLGFLLAVLGIALHWRRFVPLHVALIAAPTALLLGWVAVGQALALFGQSLSTSTWWILAWILLVPSVSYIGSQVLHRLTPQNRECRSQPLPRAMWIPSGLFLSVALVQSSSFMLASRWLTMGTDSLQQLLLVQQLVREGALVYGLNSGAGGDLSGQVYPKGIHWLVANILGPVTDPTQAGSVDALMTFQRTYAGFVWAAIAVAMLTASGLLASAGRRFGYADGVAASSAWCLFAILVVVHQFSDVVIVQGGMAAAVAIAALWSLWWVAVEESGPWVTVTVSFVAVIVAASTWQPIALFAAVGATVLLWPWRHELLRSMTRSAIRRDGYLAAAVLGFVILAAVPMSALVLAGGAGFASIPGYIAAPNFLLAAVSLGGALYLIGGRRTRGTPVAQLTCAFGAASVLGWVAMVVAAGFDVTAYYPLKLLWFVALVWWPVAAFLMGSCVMYAWRRAQPVIGMARTWLRRPILAALAAGAAIVLLAAAAPWAWEFQPKLSASALGHLPDNPETRIAQLPEPTGGSYVPLLIGEPWDPPRLREYIAAKELAFRFGTPHLEWGSEVSVCTILRLAQPAVVLSRQDESVVRSFLAGIGCDGLRWTYQRVS